MNRMNVKETEVNSEVPKSAKAMRERTDGLNLPVPTRPLKQTGLCPEVKPTWEEWMRETADRTRALLRISQKPVRRKAGKPFVL